MQRKLLAMTTICALVLSGCGVYGNKEFSFFGNGRVNIAGANQMLDPNIETFDDKHLITILNPDDPKLVAGQPLTVEDVERAFQQANKINPPEQHRNEVQERLILSSQQTCNFYKDYLRRVDAYKGFTLGSLTTALGAAAAIVTGAGAARALGGAAGITSGISAEFDQAFFKSIAIHVITPGIDSRRDRVLKQIREQEQSKPIGRYNIQAAVRDALVYHNQCTLNAGLEEAAESIKEVRDPGLRTALAAISQIQQLQGPVQTLGASAAVGGPLPDNEMPSSALAEASQLVETEANRISARITALEGTAELKDKIAPIKETVKTQKSETLTSLDAEGQKVTAVTDELSKKNAALALASNDRTQSLLTDEIVAQRMTAKALSKKLRSIAQNFKAFVQQQEGKLDELVATTKAKAAQPNPAK
jgi:hypothetical protein